MKYVPLFVLIQLVSALLFLPGVVICAALAYCGGWTYDVRRDTYHWRVRWAWLWDNEEDGTLPAWYVLAHPSRSVPHAMFVWSALRNPVNNLRFVPGVSGKGRPLYYRTWLVKKDRFHFISGQWYFKAGWLSDGYPCLSFGSGRGY